jgi:hypothetical protein
MFALQELNLGKNRVSSQFSDPSANLESILIVPWQSDQPMLVFFSEAEIITARAGMLKSCPQSKII